jgi:hypothetical protein
MAEALISPGVFLRENDQSQITAGPITVGAALIGPTVLGRVNIPTVVTSYSEYKAKYGTTFLSGGNTQEYLTSQAAYNYFQQGGTSLLVTRVASGSYTSATASVGNNIASVVGASANTSFSVSSFTAADTGSGAAFTIVVPFSGGANYYYVAGAAFGSNVNTYTEAFDYGYFSPNSGNSYTLGQWTASLISFVNSTPELNRLVTLSNSGANLIISASSAGSGFDGIKFYTGLFIGQASGSAVVKGTLAGGSNSSLSTAFDLETISVGTIMNNTFSASVALNQNGVLPSGSANNIRWQITQADTASGYFTLLIRQGNDYTANQSVLETWTNLSLDPNQNNYIEYVIGNQTQQVLTDESGQKYLQVTGSYPNASNYVRIKQVYTPTPNYLGPTGQAQPQFTSYIPVNGSGSLNGAFGGAVGAPYGCFDSAPLNLFEAIPSTTANSAINNVQGLFATDYDTAINLLGNTDAYVYDSIYAPGINNQNATTQIAALLATAQNRGDAIAVVDMVAYNQSITAVTTGAQSYDNSYGATYWPWVQVRSIETGRLNFIPASAIIPAVYEYNDKVSAEWFAPAGLNRGGLPTVIQPERRLTVAQRNTLYTGRVNPIAVFPGQGTVVYGQKTLQARASALDRVNVRRLLIALKGYIGQIAQTLVFEQNTAVTRNRFLSQVNPYLEYVQQRQGLFAFRVVMDDTNNTPDVIDRNLLVGAIYLQPTRTAEFIQLDFNILPTGVTFGQ